MLTIDLHRGKLVRVREGAGSTVTAHAGAVWITEQNSLRDVVLRAGQSFTLGRPGLALVQAFGNASISIDPTIPDWHGFVDEFTFVARDGKAHSATHAA